MDFRFADWGLSMIELPRRGHVYFLVMRKHADPEHDFGLVKIGITSGDLLRRVAQLQTGNPYDLLCFDSFDTKWPRQVEHYMHRRHADDMQQPEWLRCRRQELEALVGEARAAARKIEQRKEKELQFLSCKSNGLTRRATLAEFDLHHQCRRILKELVPAALRRTAAECRLKAATGETLDIPGIITVRYIPATICFSARLAEARFPELARRCLVNASTEIFAGERCRGLLIFLKKSGPLASSITRRKPRQKRTAGGYPSKRLD